ncbi:MAG: bifunctional 1-(5-phosphoribosyl)-5-((5-phosphoribosylamino)methylideneamino)imidazole-4-carboxamide isomerase/phosphoribosylanthranilate isomerase PriA [Actinomycetaceae bacterium]|nr:bifunctional 1-(5-phosphoribosyl)-5-((5-phosphoribosylamino)methylideneamino)imidazole-4-carboxamide isomerase/phosphoribosylanthranilate isomerase PriA [Actinomycetaceae bacterium]
MLELLPAIDVVGGRAVRLHQGEAGTETAYGDPLQIAHSFAEGGAKWIHLVDLDAAFSRGSNAELVQRIVREVDIQVEASGGLRDDASLERVLDAGAARVNIGTAAIENPAWCAQVIERFGDRIAVGLDVRGHTLAGRGWTSEGGDLFDMIAHLDAVGCARYVVTDVKRDGTLEGPNLELLRQVCQHTDRPVVASGGISSLDDIAAVASLVGVGVEGVIVGKALYAGQFTLEQALAVASGE